jgi:hypothetical protein
MTRGELKDALIASLMKQVELLERLRETDDDSGDLLEEALVESKRMSSKNWAPSPS